MDVDTDDSSMAIIRMVIEEGEGEPEKIIPPEQKPPPTRGRSIPVNIPRRKPIFF